MAGQQDPVTKALIGEDGAGGILWKARSFTDTV